MSEITLNSQIESPSVVAAGSTIDLGKERELRQLRSQVAELTERLANFDPRHLAQLTSRESYDKGAVHKATCGFHPLVVVCMDTKSVTCQQCGAELEPIDVLREYAREERRFVSSLVDLRAERSKLSEEVSELKKIRSSLRSQIKKKVRSPSSEP